MGLVAEYGVQRTGGWLMFPGNLTVYYYEKDSGREDDKGYYSEGRASVLMLMILEWSDIPAIDLDGEYPNKVQDCLPLMSEI